MSADPQRVQPEVHRALGDAGQRERHFHAERLIHQVRVRANVHREALQRLEVVGPRHRAGVLAQIRDRRLIRPRSCGLASSRYVKKKPCEPSAKYHFADVLGLALSVCAP